jgi:4-carboxymuconolactone decarboxylase
MGTLPRRYQAFQREHVEVWQAYEALGAAIAREGPLDARVRELIKLGMAAAIRGETAVHSHTHRALEAGATPEEVEHALLLGATTIGFPTMMTALTWATEAMAARAGGTDIER